MAANLVPRSNTAVGDLILHYTTTESGRPAMSEDPAESNRNPAKCCAPGDEVRIAAGKLAEVRGTVVLVRGSSECVLQVEGWPDGVYIVAGWELLEPIAP